MMQYIAVCFSMVQEITKCPIPLSYKSKNNHEAPGLIFLFLSFNTTKQHFLKTNRTTCRRLPIECSTNIYLFTYTYICTSQHAATHCNTLQHTVECSTNYETILWGSFYKRALRKKADEKSPITELYLC